MTNYAENIYDNWDWTQSAFKQIMCYSFSLLTILWNIHEIAYIENIKKHREERLIDK